MNAERPPRRARRPRRHIAVRVAVGLLGAFAAGIGWLAVRDWQRAPGADAVATEFTVDGLDCPVWCAVRLTEGIDALDGARVASIDPRHGKVVVRYDPARQPEGTLRGLLAARGFAVKASRPLPEH